MKKIYTSAAMLLASVFGAASAYAVPGDDTKMIVLSQGEFLNYVLYAGIGIFLIGMIFILLSVYVKLKAKDADIDYEEENEEEIPVEFPDEDKSAEVDEVEPETETEPETDDDKNENGEVEVPALQKDTEEPETEAEEKAEEEPEPAEEQPKVRITLSGTNNPDVKIIEFTGSAKVGRKPINDVIISDSTVSGQHCEFTYENEAVYIKDLESTNGTLVNGEKITSSEIKSGDVVVIGKLQYRVSIFM